MLWSSMEGLAEVDVPLSDQPLTSGPLSWLAKRALTMLPVVPHQYDDGW